jgi:hypothetical protein
VILCKPWASRNRNGVLCVIVPERITPLVQDSESIPSQPEDAENTIFDSRGKALNPDPKGGTIRVRERLTFRS